MIPLKKFVPRKSSLVLSCLSVGLLVAACGKSSSTSSQVQDFSGPQLYGNGLADGTVALTFDDGPGPRTAELSRYLKAQGIRATFFIQGSSAARYPDALEQLAADGHLLANHSYTHPHMTSSADPVTEVRRTDDLIKKYVSDGHFLFRAPYGDWNARVAQILNSAGLTKYVGSVFWDIGGDRVTRGDGSLSSAADWACWSYQDSVEQCLEGYMRETRELGKGIVLMHDIHSSTVDMVKLMVPQLKKEGFKFARADEAPSIVAALARRSDSSKDGMISLEQLSCPVGFVATRVGQDGAALCLSETEAQGPFTQAMQDACMEKGGGDACKNSRWSRGLAVWLHGKGRCPIGATFDADLAACVEGNNVFGPFSKEQVKHCKASLADTSSPVCESNRWGKGFLAQVN